MDRSVLDAYTALVSGISTIFVGFFVFLKAPKKKLNIVFLLFSFSMAVWLLSGFMLHSSKIESEAIFWDKLVYLAVSFVPAYLTHLGSIFTDRDKKEKKLIILGYLLSSFFAFLTRGSYFVEGAYHYPWGMHTQAKIFHSLFLSFFFVFAVMFFWKMYRFIKNSKGKSGDQVQQIKYFLIFNCLLFSGSYAFLAGYGIDLDPVGTYILELGSLLVLAFAITKYHLFETRVILTEILVIIMSIILFILPFLMPSVLFKTIGVIVFLAFCLVGYLLIKMTNKEVRAKENFEDMVKKRTKELAERNEELEQFYKTTIDRELKMAEMKQKIGNLEKASKKGSLR